jgi:hypothetical protein
MDRVWECGRRVRLPPWAHRRGVWVVPSDMKVCPSCAERIEAAAVRCRYCGSALTSLSEPPSVEPRGDEEVLGRDPKGSRRLMTAVGILVVILVAYGAILVVSSLQPQHHRPERHSGEFNIFVKVENACEEDDGKLVTTDPHGTPMAFATPDGPERYWCVSRQYLTSIGHRHQDPPPPVSEVPREFKWRWPATTFGE